MEFNDAQVNYEMLAHHDEQTGKTARRKLWNTFWLLLVITIVEVLIGLYLQEQLGPLMLKIIFITLTLVKAFYIVYTFMHLKDEARSTKWIIIAPFAAFILYFIVMLVMGEGGYSKYNRLDGGGKDPIEQHAGGGKHH
jgi:caa(3)-type oxidase subunit IV